MDPKKMDLVRQSLITVVKAMDPIDALVFDAIAKNGQASWSPNGRDVIARQLGISSDEVVVSFENLERLKLVTFTARPSINPLMAPLGNLLIRAIA
jgi:hypothetical protein